MSLERCRTHAIETLCELSVYGGHGSDEEHTSVLFKTTSGPNPLHFYTQHYQIILVSLLNKIKALSSRCHLTSTAFTMSFPHPSILSPAPLGEVDEGKPRTPQGEQNWHQTHMQTSDLSHFKASRMLNKNALLLTEETTHSHLL